MSSFIVRAGVVLVSSFALALSSGCAEGGAEDESSGEDEATGAVQSKLDSCLFLGSNMYCDGTTAVMAYDYLCDGGSNGQYVTSSTYNWHNSSFCQNLNN